MTPRRLSVPVILQQEKLEGIANCNHLHLIFNKECFPRLNISVILLKGACVAT